jgi:uncharacterized protein (DUF2141 family)
MKILCLTLTFIFISLNAFAATLTVKLDGKTGEKGEYFYALFSREDGYPDDVNKSISKGKISAKEKEFLIKDIPQGKYALTLFHDENSNAKLDTFMGIPEEGFAFSNNPRIFFGLPSFKKSRFEVHEETSITIEVKKL